MGARRTLGRTVGESAVEVSSSRSGRVSSSSSILGPILACSVPRLSGKGGAIVAAKKYRPAPAPIKLRVVQTDIRVNTFFSWLINREGRSKTLGWYPQRIGARLPPSVESPGIA